MRRPFYVLVFLFGTIILGAAALLYWADRRDGSLPQIASADGQGTEAEVAGNDDPGERLSAGTTNADTEQAGGNAAPGGEIPAEAALSGEAAGSREIESGAASDTADAEDGASPADSLGGVEDLGIGALTDGDGDGDGGPEQADASSGPTFDIVRVEPNGEALMAGRAEPNSEIEILAGDEVIASATADADGAFLVIPEAPLDAGSHNVTVREAGTSGEAGSEQQVAVVIPGAGGEAEAEEPASGESDEQITALDTEPADAGPAASVSNAPEGEPAEQDTRSEQSAGEPDTAPNVDSDVLPDAEMAGQGVDPAELDTAPDVGANVLPDAEMARQEADPAELASQEADREATEQAAVPGQSVPELDTLPDVQPDGPPETEVAGQDADSPAVPGEQASGSEIAALEAVVPVNPWDAGLAAVPPGLTAPEAGPERNDTAEPDAGGQGGDDDAAASGTGIAAADGTESEVVDEQDLAALQPQGAEGESDTFPSADRDEDAAPEIALGETEATSNGSAAASVEIGILGGVAEDGNTGGRNVGDRDMDEQAVVAATDDPMAGEDAAEAPAAAPDPQPNLAIRAAEAEAQTLYVAGEATPGTMVRVYADAAFVGEVETGDGGNWLLEVRRTIPPGEVMIRADAVEAGSLNPIDQAELPFVRYSDGVVLEPVAMASGAGETLATISADLPPPTFLIIRRGDNLWRISRRNYGRGIRYHAIFNANRDRIRNPNLIYPGQVFIVPERDISWETATN